MALLSCIKGFNLAIGLQTWELGLQGITLSSSSGFGPKAVDFTFCILVSLCKMGTIAQDPFICQDFEET